MWGIEMEKEGGGRTADRLTLNVEARQADVPPQRRRERDGQVVPRPLSRKDRLLQARLVGGDAAEELARGRIARGDRGDGGFQFDLEGG